MRKLMVVFIMILLVAGCCFAETTKTTIMLVSTVEKQEAHFVIRNTETGATGASVVYSTKKIARQDVSTSFDIIQCTDSNGINKTDFTVKATELTARVNGKTYSTNGVQIIMDGATYGAEVSFTRTTVGAIAAGTVMDSFEVIWPTSSDLVEATYEACVVLTTTSI